MRSPGGVRIDIPFPPAAMWTIPFISLFKDVLLPLYDRVLPWLKGKRAGRAEPKRADRLVERLNAALAGSVEVYRTAATAPQVRLLGPAPLTDEQLANAAAERRALDDQQPNDVHAVVLAPPVWSDDPLVLEAHTLDFAAVTALRRDGARPELLSAMAVIFCEEQRVLVLHRRSARSATYPGCLHLLGGTYIAPGNGKAGDGASLLTTLRREVLEESRAGITWASPPPALLSKELETGFIQFTLLGVNVSAADAERMEHSPEGTVTLVAFDDLLHRLQGSVAPGPLSPHTGWVPTGRAAVLAWLALGAPGSSKPLRFGGRSGSEVFDLVIP